MVKLVKQNFLKNRKLYNNVKQKLIKKLNEDIPINHVGSTSIPNMYGKNIIDVLIGAKDDIQFRAIANMLIDEGYFASDAKDKIYQFFSSTEKETGSGDTHIHLVISNTERYKEFLILKDYLLNNKSEALAYSNYKKEIIGKGIINRN
jgi:GrpB-like predicted nucleotidyltransferase (UPF0157 family)